MTGIADGHMGEVWPDSRPGPDDACYATATLEPQGRFEVRSFQCFTFTVTIGEYGLDDTGAIKIVQRWTPDGGNLQSDDPAAMNYVSATASNGTRLEVYCEPYPHQRPWYNGVRVTVTGGYHQVGLFLSRVSNLPRIINAQIPSVNRQMVYRHILTACLPLLFALIACQIHVLLPAIIPAR